MAQTIWIARHANRLDFVNPEWFNTADRRYDPPLSDDGLVQVQELADRLKSEGISRIFASPFLRTVQTAHGVANVLDVPLRLHWGLGEWLNPEWMTECPQTRSLSELAAQFSRIDPEVPIEGKPCYPETETQCFARAGQTIRKLVDRFPHEDLLFVGHGASVLGMAMGLVDGVTGVDVNASLCAVVKVIKDGDRSIMELNGDTSHLSSHERRVRFH